MPEPRSVADLYHHLTKYTEDNVRGGPGLDWSRQPQPFKEIVSQQRVSLRAHVPVKITEKGALVELPSASAPPERLGLASLSRLLFFTNGVTGLIRHAGGGQFLRAAPSAGALYPTELYVAARDVDGLEPGLYNYQVPTHELVRLWDGDQLGVIERACGGDPAFRKARACLVLTAVYWRSAWRYRERGYRRVLLDTGHVLANLLAYAPVERVAARPFFGFLDAEVNGLFFFDDAVEAALACVVLGEGPPADAGPLWASPAADPEHPDPAELLDAGRLADSVTVRLHRASACAGGMPEPGDAPPAAGVTDRSIPLEAPGALGAKVPEAILRRRSARGYEGGPVPFAALGRALGFALGRDTTARLFATRREGLLRVHVVANNVEGLESGLYRVEGDGEALLPEGVGDYKDRLAHCSLGQEIALRCGAALAFTAPAAAAVDRFGDRAYRYLHLDAGGVGQRFQLAATALGLQACGIGGFFDDATCELIGVPTDDWVLYMVTIGRE